MMSTLSRTQNGATPQPSEDEDQVIFKTPSDGSKRGSGAPSKRSSLIVTNSQNSFSPSPLSLMGQDSNANQYHGHNRTESLDADIMPSFASLRLSEPEPESSLGVNGISGTAQSSVLAPAAEIDEDAGARSRQSSGTSSNMDSPAIPTPSQQGKNGNVITGDRGRKFPQQGFQNGYGNPYGIEDGGVNFNNGIGMPQGGMGGFQPLLSPVMSPVMNGLHGVPPFSPPIPAQFNSDVNGSYAGVRPEDFNGNWSMQNMQNRINAQRNGPLPGGRSVQANGANPSAAGSASFPTLNGNQGNNNNAATMAFQQYAAQAAQGNYPSGMMSPTMTSPTFQPHQVYSPVQGPFSPYALPPPLQGGNPMYDMMSPTMSPRQGPGAVPAMPQAGRGQTQQQGQRGHVYSVSSPSNGRNVNQANGASPVTQRNQNGQVQQQGVPQGQQRGLQSPRGPGPINVGTPMALNNHAHSLSLSQGPYSPPLAATGYGPMSPPFGAFYPGLNPQTQGITPEILQAMAMSPYANGIAMQNALGGLQQDPSLMALLQQGGGPSANNRKLGLYKTELCRSWEEKGSCKYGEKCQFAHGDAEQRRVERHPKYKTEICRTFWVSGSCPYGKRCCFIHTELPANGIAPGQVGEVQRNGGGRDGMQQNDRNQGSGDGRARSMSTNSDPNDQPSSLLARISARAQANNMNANGNGNIPAPSSVNRSSDGSPVNGGIPESVIADAIARAYSAYGLPAGQQAASNQPPPRRDTTPPESHSAQATAPSLSGFSTRNTPAPSNGITGRHHRVSASVDFGGHGRNLGSELSGGLTAVGGHHRNPSASSIMPSYTLPSLSRTPISGQSSPFGNEATTPNRSVAVGSSLLDPSPW